MSSVQPWFMINQNYTLMQILVKNMCVPCNQIRLGFKFWNVTAMEKKQTTRNYIYFSVERNDDYSRLIGHLLGWGIIGHDIKSLTKHALKWASFRFLDGFREICEQLVGHIILWEFWECREGHIILSLGETMIVCSLTMGYLASSSLDSFIVWISQSVHTQT